MLIVPKGRVDKVEVLIEHGADSEVADAKKLKAWALTTELEVVRKLTNNTQVQLSMIPLITSKGNTLVVCSRSMVAVHHGGCSIFNCFSTGTI
jgi:hypothetical protein